MLMKPNRPDSAVEMIFSEAESRSSISRWLLMFACRKALNWSAIPIPFVRYRPMAMNGTTDIMLW